MNPKILFSDNLHFNSRRFESLFSFIDKYEATHFFETENNDLKACYGDYNQHLEILEGNIAKLKELNKEQLYNYSNSTINIFKLSKAELLSLLMTKNNWYTCRIEPDDRKIFNKAFNENKTELIQNMAAGIHWVSVWLKILKETRNFTHSCIFSGSLIYAKSLQLLTQNSPIRAIIIEDFFTGNDYYAEHKYSHIANNSDLKLSNFYEQMPQKSDFANQSWETHKILAFKKLSEAKNLNVEKSSENYPIEFDNQNGIIVIIGQVVNDFSIIETRIENICSINFYLNLIEEIIQKTNFNIIFKAHPWERKKANLKEALTFNQLSQYVEKNNIGKRVKIIEEYNLESLFSKSSHIVCISSQAGIEAATLGYKPNQFGDAFYGQKGFTYDHSDIGSFINNSTNTTNLLTLEEYKMFEGFITKTLQFHLVSKQNRGIARLEAIFSDNGINKLTKSPHTNSTNNPITATKRGLIGFVVKTFYSQKLFNKYTTAPENFFKDSNHPLTKALGKIY